MAYIDKENIDKKIEDIISRQPKDFSSYQNGFYTAIKYLWGEISDLPTADVVEVVRCKDCAYYNAKLMTCYNNDFPFNCESRPITREDDFCSYGERRTE